MVSIEHYCGNCGKYLGYEPVPILGVYLGDPNEHRKTEDPDCDECNIWYHDRCESCGANRINPLGVCKRCGTHQLGSLPIAALVI